MMRIRLLGCCIQQGKLVSCIDEIEKRTGYDLLSNVPKAVQDAIVPSVDKTVIQTVYLLPAM